MRAQRGASASSQGAVLVTEPATGAILALVGGRDYRRSQFNRAVQARRQPGSCFKPFVFAGGLRARRSWGSRSGLTPATLLDDEPARARVGRAHLAPGELRPRVPRAGHGASGARGVAERADGARGAARRPRGRRRHGARCGIVAPLAAAARPLALGAQEVTPLELAAAYGTLAAGGMRTTPWIVRAVTDRDGEPIGAAPIEPRAGSSTRTAFLVTRPAARRARARNRGVRREPGASRVTRPGRPAPPTTRAMPGSSGYTPRGAGARLGRLRRQREDRPDRARAARCRSGST